MIYLVWKEIKKTRTKHGKHVKYEWTKCQNPKEKCPVHGIEHTRILNRALLHETHSFINDVADYEWLHGTRTPKPCKTAITKIWRDLGTIWLGFHSTFIMFIITWTFFSEFSKLYIIMFVFSSTTTIHNQFDLILIMLNKSIQESFHNQT
jgi:hypothetical protein